MRTESTGNAGGRVAAAVMGLALVISMVAAANIVSSNRFNAYKLRAYQVSATETPPLGALLGWNVVSNSEWAPSQDDASSVVLFVVAAPGKIGDTDYWHDVARRGVVSTELTNTQFVGLCMDKSCGEPAGVKVLTLLSSMDPIQMRALKIYGSRGMVLIFRGAALQKVLPVGEDRQALVAEISSAITSAKAGGA